MSTRIMALALAALVLIPMAGRAEDSGRPDWSVGVYAEGDDEDGLGVAADITWFMSERSQLYFGATYTDTTSSLSGLTTRGFSIGGYHDFGPVGIDLWYDAWRDPDVVDARSINGAFEVDAGRFTFALLGQLRESDFEPFDAAAVVTLRNGQQLPVVATADCSLDNTGLGLRVSYAGSRFGAYLRGMGYDYDDAECGFSSPALEALRRSRPAVFGQFARGITAPLTANASTRIGAENALLESTWGGGFNVAAGQVDYALDYLYQEEHFDGLTADTIAGTVTFGVSRSLDMFISTGMTDSDTYGSTWFGGLGLRALF